ncbi:MAG: hypothetical protein LBP80_05470 [Treponema sp.]|nr:hypothetical protein [Treponema sp.]
MKIRKHPRQFFAAFFCWFFISACVSSPGSESESESDVLPFEPGVYLNQATKEELYLSAPLDMSGMCSIPEDDKTGTYSIAKSAYTDSYTITFKWSDGTTTSAFVVNGNRKTLRFGTDTPWLWVRYE